MRKCTKCEEFKPPDKFYSNKSMKDGKSLWCVDCDKAAKKPEYFFRSRLRFRHDMSESDYWLLLEKQNGGCSICGAKEPGYKRRLFCVDHDHKTGKRRGLLCYSCNLGLGKFKDSIAVLLKAVQYLEHHENQNTQTP